MKASGSSFELIRSSTRETVDKVGSSFSITSCSTQAEGRIQDQGVYNYVLNAKLIYLTFRGEFPWRRG